MSAPRIEQQNRTPEQESWVGPWAGDVYEWMQTYIERSPLSMDGRVGNDNTLYAKEEVTQVTNSFKERGAAAAMRHVKADRVVAASAGNHAQGVARAARHFDKMAEIHLPYDAPQSKVNGIVYHGGNNVEVVMHRDFMAAKQAAEESVRLSPDKLSVPPYDDEWVMAGQGTVGLEVLEQSLERNFVPNKLFVPAGGGGLLAGIAEAVKRVNLAVQVIGVQMRGNDSVYRSFHSGELTPASNVDTDCDGTAVQLMGEKCFDKVRQYVDDVVLVEKSDIGELYADKLVQVNKLTPVYGEEKALEILPEPAGILAEVGARVYGRAHPEYSGENWVTITSGGNYDIDRIESFVREYWRTQTPRRVGRMALLGGFTQQVSPDRR